MKLKVWIILFIITGCSHQKKLHLQHNDHRSMMTTDQVIKIPAKENFYIFIMAGQSNMAGRGIIEPDDTIAPPNVLTLDQNNQWIPAKEPLHYYEPTRTGLDCGLSFGKELSALYGDKITIGLVPCAVGGSSIEQWLGDSTYRGVTLYTNLTHKTKIAIQSGTLKGLLWHQGESNAVSAAKHFNYDQKLETFFNKVRKDNGVPDLPVYAGQLALFLSRTSYPFADSINNDLNALSSRMRKMYVVNTTDLTSKSDTLHFDSRSQRIMGERFAKKVFETQH